MCRHFFLWRPHGQGARRRCRAALCRACPRTTENRALVKARRGAGGGLLPRSKRTCRPWSACGRPPRARRATGRPRPSRRHAPCGAQRRPPVRSISSTRPRTSCSRPSSAGRPFSVALFLPPRRRLRALARAESRVQTLVRDRQRPRIIVGASSRTSIAHSKPVSAWARGKCRRHITTTHVQYAVESPLTFPSRSPARVAFRSSHCFQAGHIAPLLAAHAAHCVQPRPDGAHRAVPLLRTHSVARSAFNESARLPLCRRGPAATRLAEVGAGARTCISCIAPQLRRPHA